MRKYDWQYWEITPFGTNDVMGFMPEPTTYGAILGTVGLGLVAWRKRTQQRSRQKALTAPRDRNGGLIQNRDLCLDAKRPSQIVI